MRGAVAALTAALALTAPALAAPAPDEVRARSDRIAAELRCPVCQQLSVKDSPSSVARAFRERIRALVREGRSDAQVRAFFVRRYGEWILLRPPGHGIALGVWLAPALILATGLGAVALSVRRWTARARALERMAEERPEAVAGARARLDRLEREAAP